MNRAPRVVEVATGLAAAYCSKLLRDSGADVTAVGPSSGHPLRERRPHPAARPGVLYEFLRQGVELRNGPVTPSLLAGADVIIEDLPSDDDQRSELYEPVDGRVVVSISPFGRTGQWRDHPANEFVIQALCGSTGKRGLPGRPPVYAAGEIVEYVAGSYAAAAAGCFLWGARHGRGGARLDVSMLECGAVTMHAFATIDTQFGGSLSRYSRINTIPSIEPTADGFVGLATITAQQFQDLLNLIGRPDLAADESLLLVEERQRRRDELLDAIRAWTGARSTAEVVDLVAAVRIPVAPIGNGDNLPRLDHLEQREVMQRGPSGTLQPRRPYLVTEGCGPPVARPEPRAGADLPLRGLRVADFTAFWAGPSATHLLASLGAEVIKTESPARPDGMRFTSSRPGVDRWLEWSPVFHGVNANKRSVALDLGEPDGMALARRLIAWADVVIENFSPRVLGNFGLDWEEISRINPSAVMVRMPAFGLSGPWRDRTGFAMTVEQASGLAWRTGYGDGPPMDVGGVCDPVGGMHAVVALMSGLRRRADTGLGSLVEVPLMEVALNIAAEQVLQYSADGVLLGRDGNRSPSAVPQGVYRCAGDDSWVAISVETDEQWQAMGPAVGDPSWATDPARSTIEGRRSDHDLIDAELGEWTAGRPAGEIAELLVARGIAAAVVLHPSKVADIPHLRDRGFFEVLEHPVVGRVEIPSLPFQLTGRHRGWYETPAPTVGQHTDEILRQFGLERSPP